MTTNQHNNRNSNRGHHNSNNEDDPFELIERGNALETSSNLWGASDYFSKACTVLESQASDMERSLVLSANSSTTASTASDGSAEKNHQQKQQKQQQDICNLYWRESLEYKKRARTCLIRALQMEQEEDSKRMDLYSQEYLSENSLHTTTTTQPTSQQHKKTIDESLLLMHMISMDEIDRRHGTFRRLFAATPRPQAPPTMNHSLSDPINDKSLIPSKTDDDSILDTSDLVESSAPIPTEEEDDNDDDDIDIDIDDALNDCDNDYLNDKVDIEENEFNNYSAIRPENNHDDSDNDDNDNDGYDSNDGNELLSKYDKEIITPSNEEELESLERHNHTIHDNDDSNDDTQNGINQTLDERLESMTVPSTKITQEEKKQETPPPNNEDLPPPPPPYPTNGTSMSIEERLLNLGSSLQSIVTEDKNCTSSLEHAKEENNSMSDRISRLQEKMKNIANDGTTDTTTATAPAPAPTNSSSSSEQQNETQRLHEIFEKMKDIGAVVPDSVSDDRQSLLHTNKTMSEDDQVQEIISMTKDEVLLSKNDATSGNTEEGQEEAPGYDDVQRLLEKANIRIPTEEDEYDPIDTYDDENLPESTEAQMEFWKSIITSGEKKSDDDHNANEESKNEEMQKLLEQIQQSLIQMTVCMEELDIVGDDEDSATQATESSDELISAVTTSVEMNKRKEQKEAPNTFLNSNHDEALDGTNDDSEKDATGTKMKKEMVKQFLLEASNAAAAANQLL